MTQIAEVTDLEVPANMKKWTLREHHLGYHTLYTVDSILLPAFQAKIKPDSTKHHVAIVIKEAYDYAGFDACHITMGDREFLIPKEGSCSELVLFASSYFEFS